MAEKKGKIKLQHRAPCQGILVRKYLHSISKNQSCLDFSFFCPMKARFHDFAKPHTEQRKPLVYVSVFHHYNTEL